MVYIQDIQKHFQDSGEGSRVGDERNRPAALNQTAETETLLVYSGPFTGSQRVTNRGVMR